MSELLRTGLDQMDKSRNLVSDSSTGRGQKNWVRRLATFYETAALPLSYTGVRDSLTMIIRLLTGRLRLHYTGCARSLPVGPISSIAFWLLANSSCSFELAIGAVVHFSIVPIDAKPKLLSRHLPVRGRQRAATGA